MAFYSDRNFTTYQGRAKDMGVLPLSQRLRLPFVTLALGAVASLVIAAGALDWLPMSSDITGELSEIEFLTGTIGE
jgi:hypothetical protein